MAMSIKELKHSRAKLVAEMKAIITKEGDADEGDNSRFDELEKQVKDHDERIAKCEKVMQLEAEDSEPADNEEMAAEAAVNKSFGIGSPKRKAGEAKGTRFARFVIGEGLNRKNGGNAGVRYIQDKYGDMEVAKALNTTTQATGGALIPQDFREEIIELLRAKTVVRGGGARIVEMPNGNITWPRMSGAATANWQGELDDLAISAPQFDDIQFFAKKLTALVPVSNDLIRRSPINVEAQVRDDSVKQLARAEDIAFLTGDGTLQNPVGLTSLVNSNNVLYAVGSPYNTVTLTGVNNLLMSMELSLKSQNVPVDQAKWIMNPVIRSFLSTLTDSVGNYFFRYELDKGKLLGYDILETTQLPTNLGSGSVTQLMFAAMDNLLIADTLEMMADSSADATYVSSGVTVSAYQRDQTLFRTITEVDFNIAHNFAVAISAVSGWSPSGYTPVTGSAFNTQPQNTTASSAGSANPV